MVADHWDEATILERGNDLFEVARLIWRGPSPPVKPWVGYAKKEDLHSGSWDNLMTGAPNA
jgi:hypothetical protein